MMRKMKILVWVFCLLLTLPAVSMAELNLNEVAQWVAKEMELEIKIMELPKIIVLQEQELYKTIAEKMEKQLGRDSVYFKGFSAKQIVEKNAPLAYYCGFSENIYILRDAPDYVLVHEIVHFLQDRVQKRMPQISLEEAEKFLADENNAAQVIRLNQELEREAEIITEKWRNSKL